MQGDLWVSLTDQRWESPQWLSAYWRAEWSSSTQPKNTEDMEQEGSRRQHQSKKEGLDTYWWVTRVSLPWEAEGTDQGDVWNSFQTGTLLPLIPPTLLRLHAYCLVPPTSGMGLPSQFPGLQGSHPQTHSELRFSDLHSHPQWHSMIVTPHGGRIKREVGEESLW